MNIALFYLAKPRFGGWITYTAHLYLSLRAHRHNVNVYKVGARTESKQRDFGYGLAYRNLSPQDAYAEAKRADRAIITAADKDGASTAGELIGGGAALVIHDPAEMKDPLLDCARACEAVVTIRKPNVATLLEVGVAAEYIPHPYVSQGCQLSMRQAKYHATAFSRIDWDKHTDIICAANAVLPRRKRITIFGAENRLYTHNKLNEAFPHWRNQYLGRFPPVAYAGVVLSSKSHYAVDMSIIKGDGDGTQYTFLEAWDGGAVLVVNSEWILTGEGAVRHGETAIAVANAEQLAEVMLSPPTDYKAIVEGGREEMRAHVPDEVVPRYLDAV